MGYIYIVTYVLLAFVGTFVVVRPLYRIFAPKIHLPATPELVGIVVFLLMLTPLSTLMISMLSVPILAGLMWGISTIAPKQFSAVREFIELFPSWVPFLCWFSVIYVAVFLSGLIGYVKSMAITREDHA